MVDKEKAIDKIKKLLNLADTKRNDSEEEASRAMEKAQQLLLEHKLTLSDIDLSTEINKVIEQDLGTGKIQVKQWHMEMLSHLCEVYNGTYLISPGKGRYHVIASESNMQIITYFFSYLCNVVNGLADDKFSEYQNSGGMEHGKSWKNSFRIGCVRRIGHRMREQHTQLYSDVKGTSLVKVEKDAINKYKEKAYPKTVNYNGTSSNRSSSGYRAGYSAGESVSLHKGMGTSVSTQRYLKG